MRGLENRGLALTELLKTLPEETKRITALREGVQGELVITANLMQAGIEYSKVDFLIVLKDQDGRETKVAFEDSVDWSELPIESSGESEWHELVRRINGGEDPDNANAQVLYEKFSKELKLDVDFPNGPEETFGFCLILPWREGALVGECSIEDFYDHFLILR